MADLFANLHSTVRTLNATSLAIETTGRNLANINNPNYARQQVLYDSKGLDAIGIEQLRDTLLDRQVMREVSLSSAYSAEQAACQRAQASLGETISSSTAAAATDATSNTGLSAAIDDFFTGFQALAASPTGVGERQTLIQRAGVLTDKLQLADQRLSQVEADLDTQIGIDVTTANSLLSAVAKLNNLIAKLELNNPGSATDLRDQRQGKLEELAAKLPVTVGEGPDGQMQLRLPDDSGASVVLVDGDTVTGPIALTGAGLTGGAGPTTLALTAGSIQGALNARDGAVRPLRDNLDLLTRQLVTAVNGAYNPTAAAGCDFFDSTGLTAGTIRLVGGLTATTLRAGSSGAAGDNDTALAVANLASHVFATANGDAVDGTLGRYYSGVVSNLGQTLATATANIESQKSIEALVRSQRDAISGVSLDEESANLIKYQRAYQASARLFSVIDELLRGIVQDMGR